MTDPYAAIDDYNKAVLNGIVKIAARWYFYYSVIYQLQDFEAIGLDKDLVDKYFPGTVSRIEASA